MVLFIVLYKLANTKLTIPRRNALDQLTASSKLDDCNAIFVHTINDLVITAIKPIFKGEEIFVFYGKQRKEFLDINVQNSQMLKKFAQTKNLFCIGYK